MVMLMAMAKVIKEADMGDVKIEDSLKRWTLNYTDIELNSNKFYNLEIVKTNKGFFLYSQYGRTGGTAAKEYRSCVDQHQAETEAEKIVKSKVKKGYVQILLAKVDVGSEIAKVKISSSIVSEDTATKLGFTIKEDIKSSLHPAIQSVVKTWFGSIEQFIIDTLDTSKCALGQLSLDQINKGRDLLLEARKLVAAGAKDIGELNSISSKYYSNIPMNFGYRKLDINQLRFDDNNKLDTAFDILDTLENAKGSEKVLTKKNAVDEQYKSLKTEMEWIDHTDPAYKWIDTLFHKTRARNHSGLGKLIVSNVFRLIRNQEYEKFLQTASKFSASNYNLIVPDNYQPHWADRPKDHKDYESIRKSANILPLWHGSRTPNFPKIISSSLQMRKPGFTVAGSMFDKNGGLYFANSSSKSVGYTSIANSAWSGGNDKKAYLFLSDVCLGKAKIADRAYPYTLDNIKPHTSVWAKAGTALYNDEYIVYTEQQNWLRYVVEFEKA
jgi:poly [ADP-ribose] polymerase 2/3/4